MRILLQRLLLIATGCCSQNLAADEILLAVAANFAAPMQQLVAQFERATQHEVALSLGSSGKLYAQIVHGAPFHAFFSADQSKPAALEQAGHVPAGSGFTYAVGTLVLWSRSPGFVGGDSRRLTTGDFDRLAFANPRLAPYGTAALAVLRHLGVEHSTRPKWVHGENIAQTFQFVTTGNADLGFVALAQLVANDIELGQSAWIVPAHMHPAIRQVAVCLSGCASGEATHELLAFIRSEPARAIIESFGYTLPDRPAVEATL